MENFQTIFAALLDEAAKDTTIQKHTITLDNGSYSFVADSIPELKNLVKGCHIITKTNKCSNNRIPKLNDYDNFNVYEKTPIAYKETLQLNEDNVTQALKEIDIHTNRFNEAATDKDKNIIAKDLKGAKDRLLLFSKMLEGAKVEYEYAKDMYVNNEIEKIAVSEFGEINIVNVKILEGQLKSNHEQINDLPAPKYRRAKDKQGFEELTEAGQLIDNKLSKLWKTRYELQSKHKTEANIELFTKQFKNQS